MKKLYTVLPVFLVGMVLGVSLSVSSVAQPAHADLGSQIVCEVFSSLNHIGSPLPNLYTGDCPGGGVPQSTTGVLVVKKIVKGSSATPDQFSFSVNGGSAIVFTANGENDLTVASDTPYTIVETAASNYTPSYSNNCSNVIIAAGATSTCTIINTYTAPSGGGGGGGSGPHATSTDLSVAKTVSTSTPVEGQTVTYTLTVHNAGPDAADHVSVTDILPSSLTYVSDNGAGSYVPSTGVWTVGSVPTTSNVSLNIVALVGSTTATIINTASVAGTNSTDPNSANNSASATIVPTAPAANGGTGDNTGGGTGGDTTGGSGDNTGGGTGGVGGGSTGGVSNNSTNGSSGGGGGVISGPLSYGYGNSGVVLGTSTEATSAASCGLYLTDYLRMGRKNNPDQVTKLQTFLNNYSGAELPLTGYFGPLTDAAVRKFQIQYEQDVLLPWIPYGLAAHTSTGYVYKTTQRKINLIICSTLNLPMPLLP